MAEYDEDVIAGPDVNAVTKQTMIRVVVATHPDLTVPQANQIRTEALATGWAGLRAKWAQLVPAAGAWLDRQPPHVRDALVWQFTRPSPWQECPPPGP